MWGMGHRPSRIRKIPTGGLRKRFRGYRHERRPSAANATPPLRASKSRDRLRRPRARSNRPQLACVAACFAICNSIPQG